jgi:hypothetical protein
MRTLTATLLAAQKTSSRTPCVKVEARNNLCGVVNLKWTRLYTGTEPDGQHALTLPADGSLIRLRVTPSTDNYKLYRQRVISPEADSDFTQWTYLSQYGIAAVAACSLGAEVSLFWVKSTGEIDRSKSLDNGATWQATDYPGYAPSGAVTQMAAAYKSNGDLALFFTESSTLYVIKRVSGAWQSRTAWNKTTGLLLGVAVVYDLPSADWKLIVSGVDTAGVRKIWSIIYGDGGEVTAGSWSALKEITSATADSLCSLANLFMDKSDVFRCFYNEIFTGSEAYNRPFWAHSIAGTTYLDNRWREPVPFDTEITYGLAIAHTSAYYWLSSPAGVWQAGLTAASLDLSADILTLKHTALPAAGKVEIELQNSQGEYAAPGTGTLAALDTGCQIDISPGYRSSAGNEYSAGLTFMLQAYEHITAPGKSALLLEACDGWTSLKNWKARYQFRWNPVTDDAAVVEILTQVLARSGLDLSASGGSQSAVATGFYPDFTIHPGDNGLEAIDRLLSFIPDVLFIEGMKAYLVNPLATDASIYSYGTTHVILEGRYRTGASQVNRIRVEGAGLTGESFSWADIQKNGDILELIEDLNIDTTARAHERGEAYLRQQAIESSSGFIRIPVNCGQQLYDVVDITDPRAGLAAAKRRVLGMTLAYSPARDIYEHKLILGAA